MACLKLLVPPSEPCIPALGDDFFLIKSLKFHQLHLCSVVTFFPVLLHRDVPAESQRCHPSVTLGACHRGTELSVVVLLLLARVLMVQTLLGFLQSLHLLLSALPAPLSAYNRFCLCFGAVMDPNASFRLLGALSAALLCFLDSQGWLWVTSRAPGSLFTALCPLSPARGSWMLHLLGSVPKPLAPWV